MPRGRTPPSFPSPSSEDPLSLVLLLRDYVRNDELERRLVDVGKDIQEVREEGTRIQKETQSNLDILRTDIQELKDAILKKQEQSYKRIIGIQSMLLSPIIIGVVVYIIQYLITPHH